MVRFSYKDVFYSICAWRWLAVVRLLHRSAGKVFVGIFRPGPTEGSCAVLGTHEALSHLQIRVR